MGETCRSYGERKGVYRVIVEKPEGNKSIGIPRRTWDDTNVKLDLHELGCGTWNGLSWLRTRTDRGHL